LCRFPAGGLSCRARARWLLAHDWFPEVGYKPTIKTGSARSLYPLANLTISVSLCRGNKLLVNHVRWLTTLGNLFAEFSLPKNSRSGTGSNLDKIRVSRRGTRGKMTLGAGRRP